MSDEQPKFLDWFAEQYDCGIPNDYLYSVCEAYLQGLLDGMPSDANKANLNQCLSVLRSAGVMQRVLKQYDVRVKP
jgi:hypothetical protein